MPARALRRGSAPSPPCGRLKHRVFGTAQRGVPSLGDFQHDTDLGFVPAHQGDYHDCIHNRKARLHLVSLEAGLGGVNDYGAQRLRKKARQAKASGADPTDYDISPTARSFVPFYAQRLSSDCVLHGARGIQQSIKRMTQRRSGATSK